MGWEGRFVWLGRETRESIPSGIGLLISILKINLSEGILQDHTDIKLVSIIPGQEK